MKQFIQHLFIILFITGYFFTSAQSPPAGGKLFIIGGGDRTTEIMERMVKESGLNEGGYAVVLPMSSEEPDTAFYYTLIDFQAAGCNKVYNLFCTKDQVNNKTKIDSILNAKLIFISGGDQSRFMNLVSGSGVLKAIRDAYINGKMIAGTSAGAAMMSEIMITGNSLKDTNYSSTLHTIESENIETAPGLGLLKTAIIDQHFVWRSRHNRLISAIIEFPEMTGIGIDESTSILIKGNDAEVVGVSQVLVYGNPLKSKIIKKGKLAATGLTLNIYLPGDHFKVQ
jgi:cyanophycinase